MKKMLLAPAIISILFASCGTDPNTHHYPDKAKENFMKSCNQTSGGKKEMCACLFEKVQAKYTYKDFVSLDSQINAGQRPPEFMTFMQSISQECVGAK